MIPDSVDKRLRGFKKGDRIVEDGNNPAWAMKVDSLVRRGEIIDFRPSFPGSPDVYPWVRSDDETESFALWDCLSLDADYQPLIAPSVGNSQRESQKAFQEVVEALTNPTQSQPRSEKCSKFSPDVLGSERDLNSPVSCLEDSTSSNSLKSIRGASLSSSSDILESQSTATSEPLEDSENSLMSAPSLPPASLSVSKVSASEPMMSEIVSLPLSTQSTQSSPVSLSLKTSEDCSVADTSPDIPLDTSAGSQPCFPSTGTMRSGSLYPADTLPPPSLEKGYSWLESPGALSSSGSGRPPGQTKLEAQLRRVGLLRQNEVCNPKKMEQWFGIPSEWTNPLELRAATQLLEQDDLLLETASIPKWQKWRWLVFCTLIAFWENNLEISGVAHSVDLFASTPSWKTEEELTPTDDTCVGKHFWWDKETVALEVLTVHGWRETPRGELIKGARCRPWWQKDQHGKTLFPDVLVVPLHELEEVEEFSRLLLFPNMLCTIKKPEQPEIIGTILKDLGSSFSIQIDGVGEPLTVPKLYVFPGTEPDPKLQAEKGHYVRLAPLKGIEDWVEVTEVYGDRIHVRLSGGAIQGFHVKHVLAVRPPETAVSGIPLLDAALQAAVGNLEKYQKDSATNTELKEAIASAFGLGVGSSTPPWWCAIGGSSPKFWLKVTPQGKPDLQGKELIDKVRQIYSIPFPSFHPQTKEQALTQAEFAVGDLVVQYLGKAHLERTGTVTGLSPQWIGADGDKWWEVFYVVRFDDERDGCCEGEVMYDHIKKLPPDFDIEGAIATLINQKKAINPDQYRGAKGGVTSEYKKAENEVRCLQRTIDSLELMKQLPFGTLVRHKDKGEGRVLGHEIDHRGVPMSLVSFEVKDQSVPPHDLEIIENHEQKNTLSSSTANSSINKRGAEDSSGTVDAKSLVEQFPASEIDSGEPADTGRRVQPAHYEVPLEGIAYRQLLALGLSPEQAKNLLIV